MDILDINFTPKNANKFYCKKCAFICNKKSDWARHILSRKHVNGHNGHDKKTQKTPLHICSYCNKEFKTNSGLHKHKKKCSIIKQDNLNIETVKDTKNVNELLIEKILETVMSQNKEFMSMFMNKMVEFMPQSSNNINTYSIKNI